MTEDIITEDTNRKWLPLKTDIRKGSKNELCPDKGAELKVKILMYCPYIIKKTSNIKINITLKNVLNHNVIFHLLVK